MKEVPAHFEPVADLCVSGEVRIHIDGTFTLEELPAALARVGEGRALGKLLSAPPNAIRTRPGRLPRDPLIGLTARIAACAELGQRPRCRRPPRCEQSSRAQHITGRRTGGIGLQFDEDDAGRRFANVLAVVLLGGQPAGQPSRHVDVAVRIV